MGHVLVIKCFIIEKNSGHVQHRPKVICNENQSYQNDCSIAAIACFFFEIANYLGFFNAFCKTGKFVLKSRSGMNTVHHDNSDSMFKVFSLCSTYRHLRQSRALSRACAIQNTLLSKN